MRDFPRITKPCASCPWSVTNNSSDIPNFSLDLAERLAACSPDERGFGPDFESPVFACHASKESAEFACAGWLATVAHCHPRIRFAVALKQLPKEALAPGDDWPELHDTYGDVLEKLRATAK